MIRTLCLLACLALLPFGLSAETSEPDGIRIQVMESFLELRVSPGRGYPIFDVAERNERILVLKERTGWIKVRNARHREGWVRRDEMEASLKAAGLLESSRALPLLKAPPVEAAGSGHAF